MTTYPVSAPGSAAPPPLVLVVDDGILVRDSLNETLKAAGFAVAVADSGPEGMALIGDRQPDLVLLDAQMPGSDGIEICRVLRERPATRHLPVVIMIAAGDTAAITRAFEFGASDFISKPVDAELVGHRLRFLLQGNRVVRELRESQAQLNRAQTLARLGSWDWITAGEELKLSAEGARLFGLADLRVPLGTLLAQIPDEDRSRVAKAFAAARREGEPFALDHRVQLGDGTLRYLHSQGVVGEARSGGVFALSGTCQDINDRRRAEEKVHHLAHHDPLTGLPNHLLFNEQLTYILACARRNRHQLALLLLNFDLDRSAASNASFGRRTVDELMRQIAERLREAIRQTDFIARQSRGGFSIWLPEIKDIRRVMRVLLRIRKTLERPFTLAGQEVSSAASIGIALYPQDGADIETLLEHAETALQQAREQGQEGFRFYSGSMNTAARRILVREGNLRRALERNELRLFYQPQLDPASGRIIGAEAQLRWHPQGKTPLLSEDFVPLAEANGLISRFAEWTLQAACSQASSWQRLGLPPLRMSVNFASQQLWTEELGTSVARALAEADLEPRWLRLELPESILLSNRVDTATTLNFLKNLGIGITLDNFGGGGASFDLLRKFSLDALKIDQSFIRDLPRQRAAAAMVRAIIDLGHSLGLQLIAEGVKTEGQFDALRKTGCDCVLGPLVAGPIPAEEFTRFLGDWRPDTLVGRFSPAPGIPKESGAAP